MAAIKLEIEVKNEAAISMAAIMAYVEEQGNPERAQKLYEEFYSFIESLPLFPEKYPHCRKPILLKKKYRCAIYKKNHIFIYKTFKTKLVIYNVIHVSLYAF